MAVNKRNIVIVYLVLLAATFIVGAAKPVQAAEVEEPATAAEAFNADWLTWRTNETNTIVIEAPAGAWRIRPVARYIDDQLPNLTIRRGLGVSCDDYPDAYCIRITVESSDEKYYGRFTGDGINFNSRYCLTWKQKRSVASHEFLHALGFSHYSGLGSVGNHGYADFNYTNPSDEEMEVLAAYYG